MKFFVLLASLFVTDRVLASGSGAYAAGATGLVGGWAASYHGTSVRELEDWKRQNTDSSAFLTHQCGFSWEFRLYGNNSYNYFLGLVQNDDGTPHVFQNKDIQLIFDNGVRRLAPLTSYVSKSFIGKEFLNAITFSFPSKKDFEGAKKLTVLIPLIEERTNKTCEVKVEMERNLDVKVDPLTYESQTSLEFSLAVGSTVFRSESLKTIDERGLLIDFSMDGFFNLSHGIGFSIFVNSFDGGDRNILAPVTGSQNINPRFTFFGITTGYAHRWELNDRVNLIYGLQAGYGSFEYNIIDNPQREHDDALITYQKLNLAYRWARISDGYYRGDYSFGLSLSDIWIPAKQVAPLGLRGHTLGALVFIRWGQ